MELLEIPDFNVVFDRFLLKVTVPFQYAWLDEFFREMATYVFFVVTGYKVSNLTKLPSPSLTIFSPESSDPQPKVLTSMFAILTTKTKWKFLLKQATPKTFETSRTDLWAQPWSLSTKTKKRI